jgi:hypothetical protein
MLGNTEPDVWVVNRISALERANRRLWFGLGVLLMALVTLLAVGFLIATSLRVPAGTVASDPASELDVEVVRANEVAVREAVRLVDDQGRDLIWMGRESAGSGATGSTVISVYATDPSGAAPAQALRLVASPVGSGVSLGTSDGASSASLFVAADGASLELRKGETSRVLDESAEDTPKSAVAAGPPPEPAAPPPPPPAPAPAPDPTPIGVGPRAEAPAVARGAPADGRGITVDLTDPVLQALGQDFYVGKLSLSDETGGLRVSGRIVNASSVDQLRVEFRLSVANRELPFSVARIGAGNSTPFALEIPPASSQQLREARIRWVRSTLSYGTE